MENSITDKFTDKFKVNDRVRRTNKPDVHISGCYGTVKDMRYEVTATEAKAKGLLVSVQWDNGTFSYHGLDALELVESR